MTLNAPPSPGAVNALSILERDGTEIDDLLGRADTLARPRTQAPPVDHPTWSRTLGAVGRAAAEYLDLDVGEVMLAGWHKYHALIDAARRTRDTDLSLPVDLAGTSMALRQHPWVEITWQGERIGEVRFEVAVDVEVLALEATVRHGSLVELTSGRAIVRVSLSTLGEKVGRQAKFDPVLVVDLGTGIPLAD